MSSSTSDVEKKISLKQHAVLAVFSFRTLWSKSKLMLIISIIESIYNGLWPILMAYLSGQLLQELSRTIDDTASYRRAIVLLVVAATLRFAYYLIAAIKNHFFNIKRNAIELLMKKELLYKKAHLKLDQLELPETQEKFSLAVSGINAITWYNDSFLKIVSNTISIVGVLGVVAGTIPWLLPVLLPLPILSTVMRVRQLRRFRGIWDKTKSNRIRSYKIEGVFGGVSSVLEVRLLGLTNRLLKYWFSESEKSISVRNSEDKAYLIIDTIIKTVETIVGIIVDIWVLSLLFASTITIATFEQTRSLISSFINSLSQIGQTISGLADDGFQVRDYRQFLATEELTEVSKSDAEHAKLEQISLQNVHYKYPNADDEALKGVNFSIRKGEKVAIIGQNGAGKTTLIRVLLGVYSPIKGAVRVNNKQLNDTAHSALFGNSSVVMQDFSLFDFLTLGETVGLSDFPKYDRKRVIASLESVGLGEYVEEIGGLDKNFGYVDDDGIKMSGGQNQRLVIARAIYSQNELLVLDEPTSMIDAKDEQDIIENVIGLYKDRTMLIVSHKLSTVKAADRIVVMDKGIVSETGTHKELYKKGTKYYDIFHKQVEAFRE